jgi:TrmH family RNA methyltransferase
MKFTEITSLQNPKIKHLLKLRDRSTRDSTGLFIIEGYRELLRALTCGQEVVSLFFSSAHFLGTNEESLLYQALEVFAKASYRDRPDGLIGVAVQKPLTLKGLERSMTPSPLLIVAEAIEKPGNLGTILRSADGVGADGVIVCDKCTDIYNPNVVRASVGTLFSQRVCEASSMETIAWLKSQGIGILATSPAAKLSYTAADMTKPIAICVGTEQLGLSKCWLQQADLVVSIPMRGEADSLNVATATTILLYEALRQRKIS